MGLIALPGMAPNPQFLDQVMERFPELKGQVVVVSSRSATQPDCPSPSPAPAAVAVEPLVCWVCAGSCASFTAAGG
jgi:hypothetical protein